MLTLINTPPEILSESVTYLRIYFMGLPFLMIYDFGSGILRAKGDSKSPFVFLTISGVINVILNLFFVMILKLDVIGVAIATAGSTIAMNFEYI